jgi:hypothetical protein
MTGAANGDDQPDLRNWGLVVLIAGCALLLGVFDVLLIPLYVGSTPVPVAVVLAIVVAAVLPRWAYATVRSGLSATVAFGAWLAPVLVLPLYPRVEGDVLVLGGGAQQLSFYGVVLLGCAAGLWTIVKITTPQRPAVPPTTSRQDRVPRVNR